MNTLLACLSINFAIAMHPEQETTASYHNPIAVLRVECVRGDKAIFFEHISSIPNEKDGTGINMVGFEWRFDFK